MRLLARFVCIFAVLTTGAIAKQHRPTLRNVVKASFYADKFNGRKMANGDKFDQNGLTVAHLNFRLGTHLRLTNMLNNHTVEVLVSDRGPYAPGSHGSEPSHKYAIDVSRAVADALGITKHDGWGYLKIQEVRVEEAYEQQQD